MSSRRSSTRLVPASTPARREVTGLRLGQLARVFAAVGHLQGGVPVALGRLDLHDARRRNLEHGDRDDAVVVTPHLGHAHFFADDGFRRHGRSFGFSRGRSARLVPAERWIGFAVRSPAYALAGRRGLTRTSVGGLRTGRLRAQTLCCERRRGATGLEDPTGAGPIRASRPPRRAFSVAFTAKSDGYRDTERPDWVRKSSPGGRRGRGRARSRPCGAGRAGRSSTRWRRGA